ncbi:AMP-binding protein [Sporosarcina sp. Marseille-Q4063]|uniref:AMP-binding protein n=1 Tax=Sporosarcina sp. Marseille-Q4063 TaxID=2810514 RepID=UPI001BB02D32|nr:AMP-binding protein [Sporosarcina sp. Marseille-Q4063]QUW23335.1 AMP-binding protein [Sporosarcina sp. Marseille-Q4063]
MSSEQTLPKLLAERAANETNEVALRQKDLGIWNEITWGDYYKTVEQLAIVLSKEYDFKRGEKLALIGENRPQWLISQMAAQVLGGISVGVYQESLTHQLVYYLNDCGARIVIVEDQEQVDKLLEIEEQIPLVEHIIYYNKHGMRHYKHPKLSNLDDALVIGNTLVKENPDFFRNKTDCLLENDIAIIAYSAATTGNPKGAMLSHSNLIAAAENLNAIDPSEKKNDYFSFLPLAWIHEQVLSITIPLLTGMVVNFPEKPHTVMVDLREIGPQTLLAPPRVYQTLMSNFTIRMEGSSWFKKKVYHSFKKVGDKVTKAKLDKQPISFGDKLMYKLGDWLVFSPIRDHFGLARIKRAYIAGAALESESYYFFHSIGVNVKQSYGGTELAGIAFVHRDDDINIKSAGVPLPYTEVKIAEDGQILVRNPAIFSQYLHEEDRKKVVDGWITLGDCGRIDDDGHLYILDRKEDIVTTVSDEKIYPSMIENKLRASPYIQEAICFGKNNPYMVAILNIDMNSVGRWADKNRIVYTTYSELARDPEVVKFIEKEVTRLMSQLPEKARVKKVAILHKQFNADDGELTRTLKVRRKYIEEKYHTLIEGLYSEVHEVKIMDDGKESAVEINLQVVQLEIKQEVA